MIDLLSSWPALGAAGEQAWQVLRQHTEWTEGFWLAWLFTGYPPMAHELEARMGGFLHERGQSQVVLRPGTPEEARNLLEAILAEDTRSAHCVWVEIIHSDGLGLAGEESPGPWTEAWDWLMMRANERRTALAKHLPGGLVFVGPIRAQGPRSPRSARSVEHPGPGAGARGARAALDVRVARRVRGAARTGSTKG